MSKKYYNVVQSTNYVVLYLKICQCIEFVSNCGFATKRPDGMLKNINIQNKQYHTYILVLRNFVNLGHSWSKLELRCMLERVNS